jgi:arylsulfatase A-like enzyme
MFVLPIALLTGCIGSQPPPTSLPDGTLPVVEMPAGPAAAVHQLHLNLDEARYDLADSNLPEGFGADDTVVVALDGGGRRVRFPVPFRLDADARTRFGKDTRVEVDGQTYVFAPLGGASHTWRLHKDDIVLQTAGRVREAVVTYAGAQRLLQDRVVSASGRPPASFVERSLTLGGRTVPGVMLPSPSSVTWTLSIPADAPRFRTEVARMPGVVAGASSDGVGVVVEVVDGEAVETIVDHDVVGDDFTVLEADLSRWAGRKVDVRLRSRVVGSPDHDYAFIGAPTIWGRSPTPVRRVLVIGLDTTRPASIGFYGHDRPTTPELDAFAASSVVAVNAWAPAPRTRPSFRSSTTGRYPLLAVGATNVGEVFQQHGFATAGFVANIHLQPRFDFHEGFDVWSYDGLADANQQVDRALAWFEQNVDRDAYMFLHFMDPHLAYDAPGEFQQMFVDDPDPGVPRGFSRWQVSRWQRDGSLTDRRKAHIQGLYDGEMRFMSQQLGRLFEGLDALPGHTTIVVHSDHGEEFFEHGGFEHNHTLYDEVTRAVLMVRPPGGTVGGPVRVTQPATLADIAPTLYGLVGFEDVPPTDGIDLLPYARGTSPTDRPIGIGHLRFGLDRYAVVAAGHKYIVETGSGREELYALATDPQEQVDLAGKTDLSPWRDRLVQAHPELTAGPGWRIMVGKGVPSFSVTVPPGVTAGVLDPTLELAKRPNLAWGEAPGRRPETVGAVAVDGTTLTYEPARGAGQLWVLGDGLDSLPGAVISGASPREATETSDGRRVVRFTNGSTVTFQAAMVVVPPPGEAARMSTLVGGVEDASVEETCRLCELGYIEGESCDGC